jgi:hypothetical protein
MNLPAFLAADHNQKNGSVRTQKHKPHQEVSSNNWVPSHRDYRKCRYASFPSEPMISK